MSAKPQTPPADEPAPARMRAEMVHRIASAAAAFSGPEAGVAQEAVAATTTARATRRLHRRRDGPSRSHLVPSSRQCRCRPCHTDQVLVRPHLSLGGTPPIAPRTPDLGLLADTVAPRILDAMRVASARLTELGVRHVLVGGLAVGAWGHPRATKGVDFLVGEEAFERHAGGLVTMKYGVPIQVGGVAVDLLSASANNRADALESARAGGVSVAPLPVLIYLKLKSPRPKDLADVLELIRLGIERDAIRADLVARSPEFVGKWDRAVAEAWRGDE